MPSLKGRDLLLKVGDGGTPESFSTLGAARAVEFSINNQPVDATTMADAGTQSFEAGASTQSMQLRLEGLFKDSSAEDTLRAAAFDRSSRNYELYFPNGDKYAATFVIDSYARGGTHDGLETFTVSLLRSGGGIFTAG